MDNTVVPYVVRTGDYLDKVAHRMGFDPEAVWNHPKNAELRKIRAPNVLCTGDILYVPREKVRGLSVSAGTENRYVATVPVVKFEMRFEGLSNEPYRYELEGQTTEGKTDAEGKVAFELPITCTEVHIHFPEKGLSTTAKVGHLDPIGESSGVRQRLKALGYLREGGAATESNQDEALVEALRVFQSREKLELTGEVDDPTRSKLLEVHGS